MSRLMCGRLKKYISQHPPIYAINQSIYSLRFFAAPVQLVKKMEEVKKSSSGVRLNDQIKAEFIRLVTDQGHSVVPRYEALQRAKNLKLDLVEVDSQAKPPVCKLMDFHKQRYIQQVKDKERTKTKSEVSIRKGDCKEVRFSAKTELKDLKMKADTAKRLMERGYRVKCMAMGTEDQDLGGLVSQLSALIEDVAFVESGLRVEKKQAYIIVRHVKFGPSKKGGKKAAANACSHRPKDLEEEAGSEEYVIDYTDAADMPLQGQEETEWSNSDANRGLDKVFDLSHDMNRTSGSSEKIMNLDTRAASSAASSKADGFSPSRRPNFIDPNVRPSSQEAENRYARNATKNISAGRNTRIPNYGGRGPRQVWNEGSDGNLQLPQNENPRDRGEVPYQAGHNNFAAPVRHSEPHAGASSRSSQSTGFGIFSARGVDASGKYGSGVAVNQFDIHNNGTRRNSLQGNLNSQSVKPDGGQREEAKFNARDNYSR